MGADLRFAGKVGRRQERDRKGAGGGGERLGMGWERDGGDQLACPLPWRHGGAGKPMRGAVGKDTFLPAC